MRSGTPLRAQPRGTGSAALDRDGSSLVVLLLRHMTAQPETRAVLASPQDGRGANHGYRAAYHLYSFMQLPTSQNRPLMSPSSPSPAFRERRPPSHPGVALADSCLPRKELAWPEHAGCSLGTSRPQTMWKHCRWTGPEAAPYDHGRGRLGGQAVSISRHLQIYVEHEQPITGSRNGGPYLVLQPCPGPRV